MAASGQPDAPAPDTPAPSGALDLGGAASVGIGLLFIVAVVYIGILVRRRLEEIRLREQIAESLFEVEALSSLGATGFSNEMETARVSAAAAASGDGDRIFAAPSPTASPPPALSPYLQTDEPERADVVAASALSQMKNAGLTADVEGYFELHGNPHGAVTLKLRDGRRALVVPYHETEVFTRRNLRRFDLLIYVGRDGKAAVVTSLESLIAEKVGGRI